MYIYAIYIRFEQCVNECVTGRSCTPSTLSVGNRKLKQYKTNEALRCNNRWNRSASFPRNVSGQRVNTPTSSCAYSSHCPSNGIQGK